jgi:hypothetical protein
MYTLTTAEVGLLGLAVLAVVTVLIVGALRGVPSARQVVPAIVRCPLLGRAVAAELVWDEWNVRFVDVARCAALGACAPTTCNRGCLAADARARVERPA